MSFNLKIMTPQGLVFEGEVSSFTAPGSNGYFGVLTSHAPMVSAIGTGVLKVDTGGDTQYYAVSGGITEITREGNIILADMVKKVSDPSEAETVLDELSFSA